MDPLKDYQRSRLALADAVRDALHVALDRKDDLVEQEYRRLLTKLAEDRFTLAVVGQFSRGKSTLMNAILGAAYLPTGVLPMTSVITTVSYGSRPRATFRRRGQGLPVTVPLAEVSGLIAQNSATRAQLQVTDVTIELPVEILRLGFAFVDTPGIGSQIGVNTATTRQFLPQADAVIFVTGFDSPLTEAEMTLLREVGHAGNPLYLVINKRDLVPVKSRAEVVEFVSQAVNDIAPTPAPRVFGLSALQALQALQAHESADTALLGASGLPEFESSLTTFLVDQKSSQFLRNSTAQALAIMRRQRRDLSLSSPAGVDRTVVAEGFDRRMDGVRERQRELVSQIRNRVESALPTRLASQSARWQAELRDRLNPLLSEAETPRTIDRFTDDRDAGILPALEKASLPAVKGWLGQRSAEVTELATGLVSDQIVQLFDLASSPRALGAEIAGMPLGEDRLDKGGWNARSVPPMAVPGVTWTITSETRGWPHLRAATRMAELRGQLPEIVDHAITAITDRASEDFMRLTTDWVDRIAQEIAERTQTAELRFKHNLGTPGSAEHIGLLDELTTRLTSSLPTLEPHKSPEPEGSTGPVALSERSPSAGGAEPGVGPCTVCARQTQALIDYLSHAQFQLATREQDQRLHAQSRGFCALHTWQYYEMASPLGVSAGYAMLAESTAAALNTAASEESREGHPIRQLAAAVATLAAPRDGCPVCHALAEAENGEARRIANTVREGDADFPPLCLRHLAPVLGAGPTASDGRAMVRSLAARLRRNSEDMRSYALKREAFNQRLLTDEEAHAHLAGLQLLAGAPSLAKSQAGHSSSLEFPESK